LRGGESLIEVSEKRFAVAAFDKPQLPDAVGDRRTRSTTP